jgi:hypothetical protein
MNTSPHDARASTGVIFRVWKSGIHKGELVHFWFDSNVTYHRICTGADMVVCRTAERFRDHVLPRTRQATTAEWRPLVEEFAAQGIRVGRARRYDFPSG